MRTRAELERCRKNVAELNALNGAVFEHEERYRELMKRQGELVDLLDITKNQAAADQATEAKEAVGALAAEIAAPSVTEGEEDAQGEGTAAAQAAGAVVPGFRRTPARGKSPATIDSPKPTVRTRSAKAAMRGMAA